MEARLALLIAAGCGLAWADPYPRQPGVDVERYVFRLALSDTSEEIRGETRVDVRFVIDGVAEFALDLTRETGGRGMAVDAVECGGERLAYLHQDDRLTIRLPRAARQNERRSFVIRYHGMPAGGLRIGPNGYGDRTYFSLNWPDLGRQWLPMVDHPYDKAASEFLVTAADTYQVVANGTLVETQNLGNGLRMTHWRQDVPMASWLNAIAVAPFSVRHFGTVRGVPLSNWVFPQDEEKSIAAFDEPTRAAMEFFGSYIGPYPYAKLANVQATGFSGGMEHASVVFYGEKIFTRKEIPALMAHEIAHQWFGNSVTERDWEDVWLSEGFATYFALLFTEHTAGHEAFVAELHRSRTQIRNLEKKQPDSPIVRGTLTDMRQVITGLTYHKGAWTLHMLRHRVGEEAFRAGIRAFYEQYRGGNTTTADFQRVMEEKAGIPLGSFFDQWLRRPGIPALTGTWRYNDGVVHIRLRQDQNGPVYDLPVEVEIDGAMARIDLRDREQEFAIPSKHAPNSVKIDPQTVLLAIFEVQ